jgi:hypothetical protein
VWARDAVLKDPSLITTLMPLLALEVTELEDMDFPTAPAIGDGNAQPGEDPNDQSGAEQGKEPDTEDTSAGASLSGPMEFVLAQRFLVNRALDIAGKRRVKVNDTALKERLRDVEPHEYHRRMPPVELSEVPRLTKGWDSALRDDALAAMGIGPDTIRSLRTAVEREIERELTRPVIEGEVVI